MTAILFTINGKPEPAGSKRAFVMKGGPMKGRAIVTDANPKSRAWKNQVSDAAALAYTGPLLTGPLELYVDFHVVRPLGHFTKKGKPSSTYREHPTVKPDVTKLLRAIEDACTGIIWKDDAQIVLQTASKAYGEKFQTTVSVMPIESKAFPQQTRINAVTDRRIK